MKLSSLASPFGHMHVVWTTGVLFLLSLSNAASAEPLTAPELLEQGIRQEVILTDIDAAILSYEGALRHPNVGPRTKLEATFKLAECRRQLGDDLSAWLGYHEVANVSDLDSYLPSEALIEEVGLLISFAEEETAYDAASLHYLGDLLLGLDGALRHSEGSRVHKLIEQTQKPLAVLLEEAETFPDHRLLKQIQTDLATVASQVDSNQMEAALTLLRASDYHDAFLSREALSGEDEVFGYALERLDKVVRALSENDDILAAKQLQTVRAYLAPLTPWPKRADEDGTRHGYIKTLEALLNDLESAIIKNQLGVARQHVDSFVSTQAESGGMVHWHLEGAISHEFANPDILPHFASATLHLESMLDALDEEAVARAESDLQAAILVAQNLLHLQTNTNDESGAADFLESLEAMKSALASGEIQQVRDLLESYESEETTP